MPPRFGVSATVAVAPKATAAHNTNFKLERKIFHIASERGDTAQWLVARDLCVPTCLPIACSPPRAYCSYVVLIFPLKCCCADDLEYMISGLGALQKSA
jgi:hypothetical protein